VKYYLYTLFENDTTSDIEHYTLKYGGTGAIKKLLPSIRKGYDYTHATIYRDKALKTGVEANVPGKRGHSDFCSSPPV
jgi:hypothetical protein